MASIMTAFIIMHLLFPQINGKNDTPIIQTIHLTAFISDNIECEIDRLVKMFRNESMQLINTQFVNFPSSQVLQSVIAH